METKYEYGLAFLIFGVMLYIWSGPIGPLPFGDVDSSVHFALSDMQSQEDRVMVELEYYMHAYSFANFGKIWYAPQYHLMGAVVQEWFGRFNVFWFYLLTTTFIFWSVFFLIRKLYGFWPALLSASLLIFSKRDYLTFIWGLWPEKAGFVFIPVLLYLIYAYTDSYLDNKPKSIYLYLFAILTACAFFTHPQTLWMVAVIVPIFIAFLILKERRLPFCWKQALLALIILIALMAPFFSYPFGGYKGVNVVGGDALQVKELSTLFKWYPVVPYRPDFADFKQVYGTWLLLPFILLGVGYLLLKRRRKDLLMLAWLLGFYILIHLNIIGQAARVHRFLNSEAHLFFPLAVLGAWVLFTTLGDYVKKGNLEIVGTSALVLLLMFSTGSEGINNLSHAYEGIARMTPAQMEACDWISHNLPEDANIRNIGTISYAVRKWIQNSCRRYFIFDDQTLDASMAPDVNLTDYIFVDNDNLLKARINQLYLNNTLLYDRKGVQVYGR